MNYIPSHMMKIQALLELEDEDFKQAIVINITRRGLMGAAPTCLRLTKEEIPGVIAALQDTLEKL